MFRPYALKKILYLLVVHSLLSTFGGCSSHIQVKKCQKSTHLELIYLQKLPFIYFRLYSSAGRALEWHESKLPTVAAK